MKALLICLACLSLACLDRMTEAANVVTNSFRGIYFTISVTNNVVRPHETNVIHCRIVNTSEERVYFSPWDPKVATQFYALDASGGKIRLTKDLSDSFRGGPTFGLKAKETNSYLFELPVTLTNSLRSHEVCGEVTIYFDPKPTDVDSNGITMIPAYNLRSNKLDMKAE